MEHYDFHREFRALYDKALKQQAAGATAAEFFARHEVTFLARIGSRVQDMVDYAEDALASGEPDFETALLVQSVRRNYFNIVQGGVASSSVLNVETMPAKTDEVQGVAWLPRLLVKTRAKLRGELPETLMYGCAGDRRFFKEHDLHPAEFLQLVWAFEKDDAAIIARVLARAKA